MPEKPKAAAKKAPVAKPLKAAAKPKVSKDDELAKLKAAAEKKGMKLLTWEPERLAHFMGGNLTIAGLQNISKKELYDMASVAYRLMTQGRLDDAEKIFAGLTVMDPYDAYFQLVLGSLSQRKGNLPRAEIHYTRSLEIDRNNPATYANRGEVRVLLQNFAGAITDFSTAIKLDTRGDDPAAMRARVMLIAINSKIQDVKTKIAQKKQEAAAG
jgi:tetratricopeptide (TPR) repeat protein